MTDHDALLDRESLVLAVQRAQYDYAHRFVDDEDVTLAERVVDAVVLPALRAAAARGTSNRVSRTVTGGLVQANDVGEVRFS